MKVNSLIAMALCGLTAFCAVGQNHVSRVLSPEQKAAVEQRKLAHYVRTGGPVSKIEGNLGKVAIIDTQTMADIQSIVMPPFEKIGKLTRTYADFVFEKAKSGDVESLKKAVAADFAVVLVSNNVDRAVAIFPEDRLAVVNAAKLTRGFKSVDARRDLFNQRVAKIVLRTFAVLCGVFESQYHNNLLDVAKMEDYDLVECALPLDTIGRCSHFLIQAGIPRKITVTYRKACEQGWAPAPTNDVQRAIWDEIHKAPTAPILIKPETRKQKPE